MFRYTRYDAIIIRDIRARVRIRFSVVVRIEVWGCCFNWLELLICGRLLGVLGVRGLGGVLGWELVGLGGVLGAIFLLGGEGVI